MSFNEGTNLEFDRERLEGLIQSRGAPVLHQIGVACPCLGTEEGEYLGHPTLGCEMCGGKGLLFRDTKQMVGVVSGARVQRDLIEAGWLHPGDAVFSPSLHVRRISTYDKIIFTWPAPFNEGEVLVRGGGPTRPQAFPLNEDQLAFAAATPEGIIVIDEDNRTYEAPAYELKGRSVIWVPGAGPAEGKRYTVKYEGFLEWLVFLPPDERRDRRIDLGQRVILRLITASDVNEPGDLRALLANRNEGPPAYQEEAYKEPQSESPPEPFR